MVELLPPAKTELDEAALHYEDEREGLGLELLDEVLAAQRSEGLAVPADEARAHAHLIGLTENHPALLEGTSSRPQSPRAMTTR